MRPWPAEASSLDRQSKIVLAPNSPDSLYGQSLQKSGTPANGQLLSPAQGKRSHQNGRTNGARARPSGVRRAVVRQLLWVPRILCEMAQLPRLWWPQVRCACCTVLGCRDVREAARQVGLLLQGCSPRCLICLLSDGAT